MHRTALALATAILVSAFTFHHASAQKVVAIGAYVNPRNSPNYQIGDFETDLRNANPAWQGTTVALDYHYEQWDLPNGLTNEQDDLAILPPNLPRTPVIALAVSCQERTLSAGCGLCPEAGASYAVRASTILAGQTDGWLGYVAQQIGSLQVNETTEGLVIVNFTPEMQNQSPTAPSQGLLGCFYGDFNWGKTTETPAGLYADGQLYQQVQRYIAGYIRAWLLQYGYNPADVLFAFAPESGAYNSSKDTDCGPNGPTLVEWQCFYPVPLLQSTVDIVAADHRTSSSDPATDDAFNDFYTVATNALGKPAMLTELCPAHPADWLTNATVEFRTLTGFPNMVGLIYNDRDCFMDKSMPAGAQALGAYAAMGNSIYFQQRLQ